MISTLRRTDTAPLLASAVLKETDAARDAEGKTEYVFFYAFGRMVRTPSGCIFAYVSVPQWGDGLSCMNVAHWCADTLKQGECWKASDCEAKHFVPQVGAQ